MTNVIVFTKDGKTVTYDAADRRFSGDIGLAATLHDALDGDGVTISDPDWFVEFDDDTPIRNVVLAGLALGFDVVSEDEEPGEDVVLLGSGVVEDMADDDTADDDMADDDTADEDAAEILLNAMFGTKPTSS